MPKRKAIAENFFTPVPENTKTLERYNAKALELPWVKQRLTVWLEPDVLDELDQARISLRRRGLTRSRSEIIEAAVRLALRDADALGIALEGPILASPTP